MSDLFKQLEDLIHVVAVIYLGLIFSDTSLKGWNAACSVS